MTCRKYFVVVMIAFLAISFISAIEIGMTKAQYTNGSIQWGNMQHPTGLEFSDESAACYIIGVWTTRDGWYTNNFYNNPNNNNPPYSTWAYNQLTYLQQNYLPTDNFWVGDYCNAWNGYAQHWTFYGTPNTNPQDLVWDSTVNWAIDPAESQQYFDFIWTCSNGGCYWDQYLNYNYNPPLPTSPNNPYVVYGFRDWAGYCVGMPLAWTNINYMSIDGYYGPDVTPYCYIGFQGTSVGLSATASGSTHPYYDFVYFFYYYFTGQLDGIHHSVIDSLNYASQNIWPGYNFGNTILHNGWQVYYNGVNWSCAMRVFGNGWYSMP